MDIAANPEWQRLALYALGVAVLLVVLFRLPFVGKALRALFSLGLLAFGIFLLLQQAPYQPELARLMQRAGLDNQEVVGEEVRIRAARDGHFWADVSINGVERRMLIDSGATITAISSQTAQSANITADATLVPVIMRTANGAVQAETGSIEALRVGNIEARNLKVVISPTLQGFDMLGMNFLSQLESWRVEKGTLILVPGGETTDETEG